MFVSFTIFFMNLQSIIYNVYRCQKFDKVFGLCEELTPSSGAPYIEKTKKIIIKRNFTIYYNYTRDNKQWQK